MKLFEIDAGNFKLDGGAMFGVVPKTLWSKKIPADDLNLCSWKMRCLLVEIGKRLVLIDTGMGNKQSEKWQSYYFKHGDGDLIKSIVEAGFAPEDITDAILSHLHFDHAGGAVSINKEGYFIPTFKNAHYWTHSSHWNWAMNPNEREKATFLKENLEPLFTHEVLKFVDQEGHLLPEEISILTADGHTEKMLMPLINTSKGKVLFVADTIPSHAHIHIPWCMGYDVRPLQTMKEKTNILEQAYQENWLLYFDHDPFFSCANISITEKGYTFGHAGSLVDFLS